MYSSVLQNRGESHPCLTLGKHSTLNDISAQMYVVIKKNKSGSSPPVQAFTVCIVY